MSGLPRLVGWSTVGSGALLLAAPTTALRVMGADTPSPAPFLFRVVGMFMVVTGGTLADGAQDPFAQRWALVQKVGASTAVCVGVRRGVYHRRALAVAAFDAASAVALGVLLAGRARR